MYNTNNRVISFRWIAVSSVFFVGSVSVLTWMAMVDTQSEINLSISEPSWNSVALAYGIIAFQVRIFIQLFNEKPNELTHLDIRNLKYLESTGNVIDAYYSSMSIHSSLPFKWI